MSKTSDQKTIIRRYYHARAGEGVIGFDGCGAIDFSMSDLETRLVESGPRRANRYQAELAQRTGMPNIFMRRAVREFDFFYDYEFNTLMVSPDIVETCVASIESATNGIHQTLCHFGSRTRRYFFGNLKQANCLESCRWKESRFSTVYTSSFHMNQTEIGRHEVPLDHEVNYTARNQVFSDMAEYYQRKPPLHEHIAEYLAFDFPCVEIMNLSVGDTLISASLFEALWSRARPKSRVMGMTGSRPLVSVEFGKE